MTIDDLLDQLLREEGESKCVSFAYYKTLFKARGWKPRPLKEYVQYVRASREHWAQIEERNRINNRVKRENKLTTKHKKGPFND